MEKKLEKDDELKELLEEQFIKEAEAMETALFADEDFDDYEMTDEEVQASYEKLVARLKEAGIYREDCERAKELSVDSEKTRNDKIIPMPVSAMRDAGEKKAEEPEKKVPGRREASGGGGRGWMKAARVAGMFLVCVMCVFAASMTSEANRNYFINSIRILSGVDTKTVVDNDERNELVPAQEYEAIEVVEKQLGIEMPEFYYRPSQLKFVSYEVSVLAGIARLEYLYKENVIVFYIDKETEGASSKINSLHGDLLETIPMEREGITINIRKVQDVQDIFPCYEAQWERENVLYHLSGKIEIEELREMLNTLRY